MLRHLPKMITIDEMDGGFLVTLEWSDHVEQVQTISYASAWSLAKAHLRPEWNFVGALA